jgi:hypothetical protein
MTLGPSELYHNSVEDSCTKQTQYKDIANQTLKSKRRAANDCAK